MKRLIILVSFVAVAFANRAQDGMLDADFGNAGTVLTSLGQLDRGHSIAVQEDGKLLVAAYHQNTPGMLALMRYLPDGSLDDSFDGDGVVTIPFNVIAQSASTESHSIALQSDGKIVVAGDSQGNLTVDFTVFRFNTDGSLDTDFDGDGKVQINFGQFNPGSATVVQCQSDGKIVLGGYASFANSHDFAIVRLTSSGSLDTDFDEDGKAVISVGDFDDRAYAMAIQDDGKIIFGGSAMGNIITDFALVRINPDGSLDTDFDGDGKVVTAMDTHGNQIRDIRIQPDGKVVVTGNSYGTLNGGYAHNFVLVRYNEDGSLDANFGSGGKVLTNIGASNDNDFSNALVLQPDGKVIVGGTSYGPMNGPQLAVVRYNEDGSLDDTFGTNGVAVTDLQDGAFGTDVALQNDGKLVITGYSVNVMSNATGIALARYTTGIVVSSDETYSLAGDIVSFPNPVMEELHLKFSLIEAARVDFVLTGARGEEVASLAREIPFGAGDHLYTLHLPANLPVGIYYLNIQLPNSIQAVRLLRIAE